MKHVLAALRCRPCRGRVHCVRRSGGGRDPDGPLQHEPAPGPPRVITMNQRRLVLLLLVLVAALTAAPAAVAEHDGDAVHYYVALGDSLAAGSEQGGDPDDYVDQLFVDLRQADPTLRLVRFGCGGESTATMISGSLPWEGRGERYFCSYPHGSQLADAVSFLRAHRPFVSLVTIDIGANDVLHCVVRLDQSCLADGLAGIEQNLPLILSALREAAGPDVPIVGANYYNPFLAFWFASPAAAAATNEMVVGQVNPALEAAYAEAGSPAADIEAAFSTTDWTLVDGIPLNVLRICQWTLMCAPPPLGPDFHPNTAGYSVIADAFEAALP
jgi:lysophospholipase L1-like esterase